MKRPAGPAVLLLAAACASGPLPPDWQLEAHGALENYKAAYLKGDAKSAALEFARARGELASTGRAERVAQAELTRCALATASLEFDDCPGFAPLAADAGAAARAYAAYLAGRWDGLDAALLPAAQRAVVAGGTAAPIAEPLSRLVAAGALFRTQRIGPPDIAAAIEAASAQGWRRPLLAWLGVEERRAQAAGDAGAAAQIRRRIELILEGGK
ncbi:MAG: hypothetical protein WD775_04115 [Burkholderiales bacterium]